MKKEIITVKNPLTVISIFAGLAEVAGTAVLPFIAEANQIIYIWFLMLFPVFLVSLFFLTLNLNPRVLYAPSDFADEKNYMDLFRPSSTAERFEKLEAEASEAMGEMQPGDDVEIRAESSCNAIASKEKLASTINRIAKSRYRLAEELIIDRLSAEFGQTPKRDIALRNRFGGIIFDATFSGRSGLVVVEIKFVSSRVSLARMRVTLHKIRDSLAALPENVKANATFLLAVAYELPGDQADKSRSLLHSMLVDFPIKTELRMYEMKELIENI